MRNGSTSRGVSSEPTLSGSPHQREPMLRSKRALERRQSTQRHAKHQDCSLPRRVPLLPSKLGVPGVLVEDAKCERAVEAFFKCLDRASGGHGYVEEEIALRLWPTLTQHVAGAGVRQLERKLRERTEPIGQTEWHMLMSALCNMSGVRLFLSSILSAWVVLENTPGMLGKDRPGPSAGAHFHRGPSFAAGSQNNAFFSQAEHMSHSDACNATASFHNRERLTRVRSLPSMLPPLKSPLKSPPRRPSRGEAQRPASASSEVSASTEAAAPSETTAGTEPHSGRSELCKPMSDETEQEVEDEMRQESEESAEVEEESLQILAAPPSCAETEQSGAPAVIQDEQSLASACSALSTSQVAPCLPPGEIEANASSPHSRVGEPRALFHDCAASDCPCSSTATPPSEQQIEEASVTDLEVPQAIVVESSADAGETPEPFCIVSSREKASSEAISPIDKSNSDLRDSADVSADLPDLASTSDMPKEADAGKAAKKAPRSSKVAAAKRKSTSQPAATGMRRSLSQPAATGTKKGNGSTSSSFFSTQPVKRQQPLPALPRVPVAVPNSVRLPNVVAAWKIRHFVKFREGNVFKVIKEFRTGDMQIQCGKWGRVQSVSEDGSLEIVIDEDGLTAQVARDAVAKLDLQVVTHEVKLITKCGQPTGKSISCIVKAYQSQGFLDILCQDGRHQDHVHSVFMRELPEAEYTDIGYSANTRPTSALSRQTVQEQIAQRMRELQDVQDGTTNSVGVLPPAGFLGSGAGVTCPGMFSMGCSLNADRAKVKVAQQEASDVVQGQDGVPPGETAPCSSKQPSSEAPASDGGGSICPFVEIGDGGLRDMISTCAFTSEDTVFDVGCGKGKMLHKILEAYPCRGVGVEVNCGLARAAEKQLWRYGDRARVVLDDVCNVDLKDATAVVSYMLSHSFNSHGAALKEHLSRSLRPGAVVLNSTYPVPGWCGSYKNGVYRYTIGQHLPDG
mmetsp:Transcript_146836/g.256196  ORF Transcript_146836/g.256196 Transcript_146836/m.256196 type:complete len:966 (+) Transcript_146836:58-2955(+)